MNKGNSSEKIQYYVANSKNFRVIVEHEKCIHQSSEL